ncbi:MULTISPECIES: hypothetical protein [unclassified Roseovarius]|uniref:hypothetical protein n=1 Tax=unclassified Roseovarius TaxID=2614913 RepID=UPI00273F4896|nr:hypothetical protein [Roseovarius sp. MMSF_3350]
MASNLAAGWAGCNGKHDSENMVNAAGLPEIGTSVSRRYLGGVPTVWILLIRRVNGAGVAKALRRLLPRLF